VPVIVYHLYAFYRENIVAVTDKGNGMFRVGFEPVALSFMLFLITLNSGSPGAFIYFQF
jgi:uncharacterized membrane protein